MSKFSWILAFLAVSMVILISCQKSEINTSRINLLLDDSLGIGTYDSIRVEVLRGDSSTLGTIFSGPYNPNPDHRLNGLILPEGAPADYIVRITAYKSDQRVLEFEINISPNRVSKPVLIFQMPSDTSAPRIVFITPEPDARVTSVDPIVTGTIDDTTDFKSLSYRISPNLSWNSIPLIGSAWRLPSLSFPVGACTVFVQVEDSSGNINLEHILLHKWLNVFFIRLGKNGNGTSWKDAFGHFRSTRFDSILNIAGAQIWVSKGLYEEYDSIFFSTQIPNNGAILGGFSDVGAPTDSGDRNPLVNPTIISYGGILMHYEGAIHLLDGIELRDCRFEMADYYSGNVVIRNCNFINTYVRSYNSNSSDRADISFFNCKFFNHDGRPSTKYIEMSNNFSKVLFQNCEFSGNITTDSTSFISIYSGTLGVEFSNCRLLDVTLPGRTYIQANPILEIRSSIVKGGITVHSAPILIYENNTDL